MTILHFVDGQAYEFQQLLRAQPVGTASLHRAVGEDGKANIIPFKNIGVNRPLTVEIRHVHLGSLLPEGRRWRSKSLLVTSAMKSVAKFEAEPRAINFLSREVGSQRGFNLRDATQPGTPVVYYSPALTQPATTLTIEIGLDEFDRRLFTQVGDLLESAGKLPIFVAWGGYLMAAGSVVKLASRFLERFLERGPVFRVHEAVDFVTPGGLVPMAGFKVLGDARANELVRAGYAPDHEGVLADVTGKRYDGPVPYVTITLDGTERSDLNSFEPAQATAAILSDFFAIQEEQNADFTLVMDSLKLMNDLKFRQEADRLQAEIERLGSDPANQENKVVLEEQLEATIKNIIQHELRP